jgi:hypothetical protein
MCMWKRVPKAVPREAPLETLWLRITPTMCSAKTQKEAIDWAKKNGDSPLVARVRHLNDKKITDYWRAA